MKKLFKVIAVPVVTLLVGLSVLFTSSFVFASGARVIEGPSGSDSYSKTTYYNAYDHSAKFDSTIVYSTSASKWVRSYGYGTATVFNLNRWYLESNNGLTQAFRYTGMGQYNDIFTQVDHTMYHYY